MMLSVIIPTCDRDELLGKCLDRLHPSVQSVSAELYEVIVTDDSSNPVSKEFISNHYGWVQRVEGPKKGPAANRNNGANYAEGDWLIFIDDDCLPGSNLLNEYINAIGSNPKTLAFEGAIFPDDWKLLKKDMAECPVNTDGGCFWSANICVQKKLFESIGGFNEQFLIAAQEDQEIYQRIQQYTKVPFCKNATVIHPVRYRRLNEKIRRIPIEIKNWILFARLKHSWGRVFVDGAVSQIKACGRTVQQNKFGMVVYHLFSLAYLIPGIILFAFENRSKQKI